jgi:hypothetical protein
MARYWTMTSASTTLFLIPSRVGRLTPQFSCKHTTTIAAKPHPKSACQLQRSLGIASRRSFSESAEDQITIQSCLIKCKRVHEDKCESFIPNPS